MDTRVAKDSTAHQRQGLGLENPPQLPTRGWVEANFALFLTFFYS